jgi:hypothetical protein
MVVSPGLMEKGRNDRKTPGLRDLAERTSQ